MCSGKFERQVELNCRVFKSILYSWCKLAGLF